MNNFKKSILVLLALAYSYNVFPAAQRAYFERCARSGNNVKGLGGALQCSEDQPEYFDYDDLVAAEEARLLQVNDDYLRQAEEALKLKLELKARKKDQAVQTSQVTPLRVSRFVVNQISPVGSTDSFSLSSGGSTPDGITSSEASPNDSTSSGMTPDGETREARERGH